MDLRQHSEGEQRVLYCRWDVDVENQLMLDRVGLSSSLESSANLKDACR